MPSIRKVVMESLYGQHAGDAVDVSDLINVVVEVLGTWVGTVAVQISEDGVYWATPNDMTPLVAIGHYHVPSSARFVRVNCTAYTSGTIQAHLSGDAVQVPKVFGTLGDLASAAAGDPYYIGDQDTVIVQVTGRDVGTFTYTATAIVEVSQDGTNWAPAQGSAPLANVSGAYPINGRAQYVRVRLSAYTQGIASCRVGGRKFGQTLGADYTEKCEFGSLGDVHDALPEAAKDISTLDAVAVTLTFSLGANMTVSLEELVGTFWLPIPGATGFAAGTDVTFCLPKPVKQIRANPTAFVAGTCAVRYGGADLRLRV